MSLKAIFSELVADLGAPELHLTFRARLAKVKGREKNEGILPKRINEIMGLLRKILTKAAHHFEFTSPMTNIKKLKQHKTDVAPSTIRFLIGMRAGEVHDLKCNYVDFDLRIIRVRETFVLGEEASFSIPFHSLGTNFGLVLNLLGSQVMA